MSELFESKNKLSNDLQTYINEEINQYGYFIKKALIMDIDPPDSVKQTMNLVLESQRKREAAVTTATAEREAMILKAQAEKETMILRAQANAETRRLEGEGLAAQRQALMNGLKASMNTLCDKDVQLDPNELTNTILTMQYIDMLSQAANNKNNTFIMQCHPNGVNSIEDQVRIANLSSKTQSI
jgi:regulator of protease activity HflC (stomatin/prohibitin superfamily)